MARRPVRSTNDEGVRFPIALTVVCMLISVLFLWMDRPETRAEPLGQFRAGFNDLTTPVLEIAASPLDGVANIGPWWLRQRDLAEENHQLRLQLGQMASWRDVALSFEERNRRYREALNVQGSATVGRISAWAVADQTTDFVHSRLINAGQSQGVRPGLPAVNLYGLIGRTVDVGQTSTRVLLLTDFNSRVAVMSDRSNARALLVGDNSSFPKLEYLGEGADVRVGDRLITSGDDNVMPRGLPIGDVVLDRDGNMRVALYSRGAPIDLVWVWPFEPTPLPEPITQAESDEAAEETTVINDDSTLTSVGGGAE
jgi:rod shape-determining protein MreC